MESKQKPIPKEKTETKSAEVSTSHAVTQKVQTAEGWRRSSMRDLKKRKYCYRD